MRKWWQCDKCERILPEDLMNMFCDTSIWCDKCFEEERLLSYNDEEEEGDDFEYDPDPPRKPIEETSYLKAVGDKQ